MPQADESDNRGGFHEIDVATETAKQSPRAISESGGRAERHEGVHVGATDFELVPCAQFALTRFGCMLIGDTGTVARVLDSLDHGGNTGFSPRRPADRGLIGFEAHSRAADATHTLDGLGHVPGAIAAGHARDGEFGPGWRDRLHIALWFQFGRQFSPHSLDRVYANKEECLTRIFYAVASEYPIAPSRATISRGPVGEPSQYRPT